jgi:UDP-N-acetylglucosamine 2-epimerase
VRWIVNLAQSEGVGDESGPVHHGRLTAARALPRIGTDRVEIVARPRVLLDDSAAYAIMDTSAAMAYAVNPYGNGHATARIVKALSARYVESEVRWMTMNVRELTKRVVEELPEEEAAEVLDFIGYLRYLISIRENRLC